MNRNVAEAQTVHFVATSCYRKQLSESTNHCSWYTVCCSLSELHRAASGDQQVLSDLRCSGAQGETSPQHPVRETSDFKISVCSWLLGPAFRLYLSACVCLFCVFIYCVPCLLLSSFLPFLLLIFLSSLLISLCLSSFREFQFLLLIFYVIL
jgi:hypothetical protein